MNTYSSASSRVREDIQLSRSHAVVAQQWVKSLPSDAIRKQLLVHPLDGLCGPTFGIGECLDPLLTAADAAFFEPWAEGMMLKDGDIIAFRWGPDWREFAQQAYGTDLSVKLVHFMDGQPWLVCREWPAPFAERGHEVLGVLRAIRSQCTVALELWDAVLLDCVQARGRKLAEQTHSLGTFAMMTFADLAMNGQMSGKGPKEKAQREALLREGWLPYGVKIGDRWLQYKRLDPIGSLMGMSADMVESFHDAQHELLQDSDVERVVVAGALTFANNLTNKAYLSGMANLFEAMADPQQKAERWEQQLIASLVPGGGAQVEKLVDPYVREVNSMNDALRARIPGLSDELPPKRDLWGEPVTTASGLGKAIDLFSPIQSTKLTPEPIDEEILRIESNITLPPKKSSFDGVTIDLGQYPKAYSRYLELAGNELKHPGWNMGAKDLLNAVVSGQHPLSAVYRLRTDGPDGGKDVFIRDTVRQYREMARKQLLKEFPDLAAEVRDKQAHQRALRLPVTR